MKNIVFEIVSIIISSIIVSLTCWYYSPESTIKAKIFLPIIIVLLIILYGLIKYIFHLKEKLQKSDILILPKLKLIENDTLIFSPSELFSTDSFVSIWLMDDVEKNVGYGYIETVNTNKFLQVKVDTYLNGYNLKFIKNNKNKIVLRPTIHASAKRIISTSDGMGGNND